MSNPQEIIHIFKAGTGMRENYLSLAKPKFQFKVRQCLRYKWEKLQELSHPYLQAMF